MAASPPPADDEDDAMDSEHVTTYCCSVPLCDERGANRYSGRWLCYRHLAEAVEADRAQRRRGMERLVRDVWASFN